MTPEHAAAPGGGTGGDQANETTTRVAALSDKGRDRGPLGVGFAAAVRAGVRNTPAVGFLDADMTLDEMLAGLEAIGAQPQPRRTGSGWTLRCPHPDHQDDTPSASLRAGDTQPVLLHCFACTPANGSKGAWLAQCVARIRAGTPLPPANPNRSGGGSGSAGYGHPVADYAYCDQDGQVIAKKIRYQVEGGRKSFSWKRPYSGGWVDGLGPLTLASLPMYGLPSLARPGTVYVVEGEKDADRLHTLGVAAVTGAGGANKDPAACTLPEDLTPLAGRDVVVIGDRDPAGVGLAKAWQRALQGVAASVRMARSATTGRGDDVSDHLDAGHSLDQLDHGPQPEPPPEPPQTGDEPDPDPWADVITGDTLDAMHFEPVTYLVDPVIPKGGLVALAGAPKVGKSALALGCAVALAAGNSHALDGLAIPNPQPRPVLYVSLDDPNAARFQRRARGMTGDNGTIPPALLLKFTRPTIPALAVMLTTRPVACVVIDTVERLRPPRRREDTLYDGDVAFYGQLQTLAAQHPDTTFLLLMHTRKGAGDDDAITAVSGTHGVTGGVDHVLRMHGARHAQRRVLEVVSRDADDRQFVVRWMPGGRLVVTDDDPDDPTVLLSEDDGKVYRAVRDFGTDVTPRELALLLPNVVRVDNRLRSLSKKGLLVRRARGSYALA